MASGTKQVLSRVRGWAASGQVANVAAAIANGALTGHQPWYVVLLHLAIAAAMPAPIAAAPKQ